MSHVKVDVEQAFGTAHSVGNDAIELSEELDALQRDWDSLSRGWMGSASAAYSEVFAQWAEGATEVVDCLLDLSERLGRASADYAEQDVQSGDGIHSAAVDLGL